MRPAPTAAVAAWAEAIGPGEAFWTSVTAYEIAFGIERLAPGARKDLLTQTWTGVRASFPAKHILKVDIVAAIIAGKLKLRVIASGRMPDVCDLLIAGVATREGATLATRNTRHFEGLGIKLTNPWEAGR